MSANRLAVIFTDTKEIAENEINPGWNTSKTFTVENRSGEVFYYDINIETLVNTFVTEGYLQYKITSNDGGYNMDEYVDIPKSEEARREKLASNIEIANGNTHTYIIEFRYLNDMEVNQSDDMGKELSGSLSITESNILLVKYKVEGIIQDTIPDKTEPIIVDKVECSNNVKGTWNDITEKVDFENEVTQTVCIVSFKEGNTITLSLNNQSATNGGTGAVYYRYNTNTYYSNSNLTTAISKITVPTRTGYTFGGYYTAANGGGTQYINASGSFVNNPYTKVTGNTTLYAKWTANTYTVTYNQNNGSGVSPASNTVTFGGKYKLPTTKIQVGQDTHLQTGGQQQMEEAK